MRSEAAFLCDILDAVDAIERYLAGKSLAEFEADDQLRSAVLFKLFTIGEASTRISEKIQDRYPAVPWSATMGFRNFVAHHYFSVRWSVVWNTATVHAPDLRLHVQEILRNEFPNIGPANA